MALPNTWMIRIQALIDGLSPGDLFELKDLMGDKDWAGIAQEMSTTPQKVGIAFSKAVQDGEIASVEYSHVQRSPHATIWRRT